MAQTKSGAKKTSSKAKKASKKPKKINVTSLLADKLSDQPVGGPFLPLIFCIKNSMIWRYDLSSL